MRICRANGAAGNGKRVVLPPPVGNHFPHDATAHAGAARRFINYLHTAATWLIPPPAWQIATIFRAMVPDQERPVIALAPRQLRDLALSLPGLRNSFSIEFLLAARREPGAPITIAGLYLFGSFRKSPLPGVEEPDVSYVDSFPLGQAVFSEAVRHAPEYWLFDGRIGYDRTTGPSIIVDNHYLADSSGALTFFGDPMSRYVIRVATAFPQAYLEVHEALARWAGLPLNIFCEAEPTRTEARRMAEEPEAAYDALAQRLLLLHQPAIPYGAIALANGDTYQIGAVWPRVRSKAQLYRNLMADPVDAASQWITTGRFPSYAALGLQAVVTSLPDVADFRARVARFLQRPDHMAPADPASGYAQETIALARGIARGLHVLSDLSGEAFRQAAQLAGYVTPATYAAAYWARRALETCEGKVDRYELIVNPNDSNPGWRLREVRRHSPA